jgi:hypothetical protein
MNLKGNSRGNLHESQGDYLDPVHSDRMVLGIIRQGGWTA